MKDTKLGLTETLANQLNQKNEGLATLLAVLAGDWPEEAGQIVENNLDWLSSKIFIVGESKTGFSCQFANGVNLEFAYDIEGLKSLIKYAEQPNKLLVLSKFDTAVQQELAGLLFYYQDSDIMVNDDQFVLTYNDSLTGIKFGTKIKDVSNIISSELRYVRGKEEWNPAPEVSKKIISQHGA